MDSLKCYDINITWDGEAGVWIAVSDEIPLAMESGSYDALIEKVKIAAPEILSLNVGSLCGVNLLIKSERLIVHG